MIVTLYQGAHLKPFRSRLGAAALALMAATAAIAQQDFDARLAQAERLGNTDPARAAAALEALAAEAATARELPRRRAAQAALCMTLSAADPAGALKLAQAELADAGPRGDAAYIGRLRLCRGNAYVVGGHRELAGAEFEYGVAEGERLKDQALLAHALVLRGEQRGVAGQYADAIADLKNGYDLEAKLGDAGRQSYALNAIANLYADQNVKDYEHALQSYRKLLAAHQAAGARQDEATAYFNIASTLEKMGRLDEARRQFEAALAIDRERAVGGDIAYDERALAVVLSKLGLHDDALRLLEDALRRYRADKDQDGVASALLSRGAALRRAGRHAQALPDLEAARGYYQRQNNLRYLDKIHEEYALALAAGGNWRDAYAARGEQMRVEQALQRQLLDERTSRLRVQFHSEALARENASQRQALDAAGAIRRWQLAALALCLAAIAALAVLMARQVRHSRRMRDLALTDELTRLPNRRHFLELARGALEHAQRERLSLAFAALDIDHFKRVNDTHGHAVGDVVLQRVAHAARLALRPGDVIGRTGGEEFMVLLRGASLEQAMGAAERIREAVAATDCGDQAQDLFPSISVGVAALDGLAGTLELACKRADDALYRAKANGRNRVEAALA